MEGVHRGVKQFSSIDDAEKDLIRYSLVTDSISNVSLRIDRISILSSNEGGKKEIREIRANFIPERIDTEMNNKFYIFRARLF